MEFHKAMRGKFGFKGSGYILNEIFRKLDADGSGSIGFDELFEFVRGRRHSLDERTKQVRAMKLEVPPNAVYTLDDIAWDVDTLKFMLQRMMGRYHVGPSDLIRAWDTSGDGQVDRNELVSNIRRLCRSVSMDVWEGELKPVVLEAFADMDKRVLLHEVGEEVGVAADSKEWNLYGEAIGQGKIDIMELERWFRIKPSTPATQGGKGKAPRITLKWMPKAMPADATGQDGASRGASRGAAGEGRQATGAGIRRKKEAWSIGGRRRRYLDELASRQHEEGREGAGARRTEHTRTISRAEALAGLSSSSVVMPLSHASSRHAARPAEPADPEVPPPVYHQHLLSPELPGTAEVQSPRARRPRGESPSRQQPPLPHPPLHPPPHPRPVSRMGLAPWDVPRKVKVLPMPSFGFLSSRSNKGARTHMRRADAGRHHREGDGWGLDDADGDGPLSYHLPASLLAPELRSSSIYSDASAASSAFRPGHRGHEPGHGRGRYETPQGGPMRRDAGGGMPFPTPSSHLYTPAGGSSSLSARAHSSRGGPSGLLAPLLSPRQVEAVTPRGLGKHDFEIAHRLANLIAPPPVRTPMATGQLLDRLDFDPATRQEQLD